MGDRQSRVLAPGLAGELRSHIIGQDEIVDEVAQRLRIGEAGLSDADRPRGSFLFLGPTGVGKTELALTFTRKLFGRGHLVRLDMSEYQHPDSVFQFLGRPGQESSFANLIGQAGGGGTVLLDEIEKAYPPVLDLLLQILDTGRLTLSDGSTLKLSPFYIVMTSNIASKAMVAVGHRSRTSLRRFVEFQAQQVLRPELFARIDSVQVFNRLTWADLLAIAEIYFRKEIARLEGLGTRFEQAPNLTELLAGDDLDQSLGVRPLKQKIDLYLRSMACDFFEREVFAG